jgi:hypothetical protein
MALAFLAPVLIILIGLWPKSGRAMAVVVSPFGEPSTAMQVVVKAGGMLVAGSPFENLVFARSTEPDFVKKLYADGAWLVFDAPAGCLPEANNKAFPPRGNDPR